MAKLSLTNTYEKYPAYKDSGVEWIGKIPKDWDWQKARQIYREIVEHSANGEEELLSVSEYFGVKPRKENIKDGDNLTNAATLEGYKKCEPGDLVMNIMLAWKTGLGVSDYEGIVSPAYCVFRLRNQDNVPKYMHYLLRTRLYTEVFKQNSTGVIDSRLRMYPDKFYTIPVLLPPKEEQEKIAKFLDEQTARIDETIAKKQRLIELLKEKRTATINHVVTKGLDPNVELVDSGIEWIGEVPKNWQVLPLKHVAFMQEGPGIMAEDFKDSGVPLLRIRNLKNREIDLEGSNFLDEEKANTKWKHFQLAKGDLLVSGSASTGVVSEVGESAVGSIPYTGLIRITAKKVEKDFLYYVLASRYYNEQIDVQKTGTAMQHYGPTHLKKVSIAVPPEKEQQEIVKELEKTASSYLTSLDKLTHSIGLLQEFKSSLISHAVTGKIKV